MNDVVAQNGQKALAAYNGGSNPFVDAGDDLGAGDMGAYMKFNGNSGDFTVGKEQDELEEGKRLIADMQSAARGSICWVEGEVADEVMVRVVDGKPPGEDELENHGPYEGDDGWNDQVKINFKDEETGETYIFKSSSKSALRAFGVLMKDYGRQFKNHPDEYPIVELGSVGYMPKDKKIGKKYAPTFKIVDWISVEESDALESNAGSEDDEANYTTEEKVETTTAAAPVEEKAAPVEGRRRSRSF